MNAPLTLRAYQARAVDTLRACHRGIVWSPAGSGKTIIAAAALDREATDSPIPLRIAWVANTQEQVEQAENALALFNLRARADVMVCCAASEPDLIGFDIVVVDECHHAAATGWALSLSRATGRVWGLTATPYRADEKAPDVFKVIGPIVCEISREEVGEKLAPATVRWLIPHSEWELNKPVEIAAAPELRQYHARRSDFDDTMRRRILYRHAFELGIIAHANRNRLVVSEAASAIADGHSVLVIVRTVEHGQALAARVPGAELVFAKLPVRRRRELIAAFRDGSLKCLISTSLADEGLDVPRASVLVLACGGRSSAKTEQRTGRVLRAFSGKSAGLIVDFHDQGHGMLVSQSRARSRLYQSLGYREVWVSERESLTAQGQESKCDLHCEARTDLLEPLNRSHRLEEAPTQGVRRLP